MFFELPTIFSRKKDNKAKDKEATTAELYRQIGRGSGLDKGGTI
jgi:hypothetical protein